MALLSHNEDMEHPLRSICTVWQNMFTGLIDDSGLILPWTPSPNATVIHPLSPCAMLCLVPYSGGSWAFRRGTRLYDAMRSVRYYYHGGKTSKAHSKLCSTMGPLDGNSLQKEDLVRRFNGAEKEIRSSIGSTTSQTNITVAHVLS